MTAINQSRTRFASVLLASLIARWVALTVASLCLARFAAAVFVAIVVLRVGFLLLFFWLCCCCVTTNELLIYLRQV